MSKDLQSYINLIRELETVASFKPPIFQTFSCAKISIYENDYDNFCYRTILDPPHAVFGIDFISADNVKIYIWIGGSSISVEELLEACSEECKKILLFNLDLVT